MKRNFSGMFMAVIFIAALTICGCSKKQQKDPLLSKALLQHMKNQDIPIPVGFTPTEELHAKQNTNPNNVALCYKGNLSINQSVNYFKKAMELNGWHIEDFSLKHEGLLFCNKSKKHCAISIRPMNKKLSTHSTSIYVMVQHDQVVCQNQNLDNINTKAINIS